MASTAEAMTMSLDIRVRTPMSDRTGKALNLRDRVQLDDGTRTRIIGLDRAAWTIVVTRRRQALTVAPDTVRRVPRPRKRPTGDHCQVMWCAVRWHQVHEPGCPNGDGLEHVSLDYARCLAELVASDDGRFPQFTGRFNTWRFARARRELVSKGGLQAAEGERVLVAPCPPPWWPGLFPEERFFSMRRGITCVVSAYDLTREP